MNLKKVLGGKKEYLSLIQSIKGNLVTFNKFNGKKVFCIRHDIDRGLKHSLKLAKLEKENGIQSTYFVLHNKGGQVPNSFLKDKSKPAFDEPCPYFDYSEDFALVCREIVSLGHTIGFHNNAITEYISSNDSMRKIIERPLKFLRNYGIEVTLTSAHGDKECYTKGYRNYEVWVEFNKSKNEGGTLAGYPKVSLSDYGLNHEVYFLPFTHYLTDSGCKWKGYIVNGKKHYERIPQRYNLGKDVLKKFNGANSGFLQILLHPCWWDI